MTARTLERRRRLEPITKLSPRSQLAGFPPAKAAPFAGVFEPTLAAHARAPQALEPNDEYLMPSS
jgi:hypothetical protein